VGIVFSTAAKFRCNVTQFGQTR